MLSHFSNNLIAIFKERKGIAGLDGLRAVCVTLVIIHHSEIIDPKIDVGALGVFMFFCISGYLIIPSLLTTRRVLDGSPHMFSGEVGDFLFRRSIRIFPAYYAALTFIVLPLYIHSYYHKTSLYESDRYILPFLYIYLTNFYVEYIAGYWPGSVSHFWSLAIEQQFYLLFPFVFLFIPSRRWLTSLIGALFILMLVGWSLYDTMIQFYAGTLIGFFSIISGGVAALLPFDAKVLRPSILFCLASIIFLSLLYVGLYREGILIGSLLFALFLKAFSSRPGDVFIRALDIPALRGIGVISYGFYLYHNFMLIPASVIARKLFGLHDVSPEANTGFLFHCTILIIGYTFSVAISVLSFIYIEKPFLNLRKNRRAATVTAQPIG